MSTGWEDGRLDDGLHGSYIISLSIKPIPIHECFEKALDMLSVRDIAAICNEGVFSDGEDSLDILEACKTPKAS
jgi:hypothetical protein